MARAYSYGAYLGILIRCHLLLFCSAASQEDAVHVVLDRHLVTGQNLQSTSAAVNNLILLCNGR